MSPPIYDLYRRGQRYVKRRPLSPTREQKLGLCIEMHGQALFQEPVLQKLWVPKQPYRNAAMGAEQQPTLNQSSAAPCGLLHILWPNNRAHTTTRYTHIKELNLPPKSRANLQNFPLMFWDHACTFLGKEPTEPSAQAYRNEHISITQSRPNGRRTMRDSTRTAANASSLQ